MEEERREGTRRHLMRCAFSLFPHSLYYMLLSLQCHFTKPHSSIELSPASQGSGSFTRSLRKLGARTLQCFDTWAYERGPRVAAIKKMRGKAGCPPVRFSVPQLYSGKWRLLARPLSLRSHLEEEKNANLYFRRQRRLRCLEKGAAPPLVGATADTSPHFQIVRLSFLLCYGLDSLHTGWCAVKDT